MAILAIASKQIHAGLWPQLPSLGIQIVLCIDTSDDLHYSGAIRSAPSNRITEPFMKVFSAM